MSRKLLPWLLALAISNSVVAAPLSLDDLLVKAPPKNRITIARHYLGALVADLEQQAANERMAMAYVAFNRSRPHGDVTLDTRRASLEMELRYMTAREARSLARQRQQSERLALTALTGEPAKDLDESATSKILERLPRRMPTLERLRPRLIAPHSESDLRSILSNINHFTQAVLPRLTKEEELNQLKLDKAREDLAAGRKSDLGAAMVEGSELAFRKAEADANLALAILRLESLIGSAISTVTAE